ncbi:MAG TPA: UDP-3-O-acyl-N-acetylglucosamine deacetylase [Candidatus Hypogeohydataceae bacterium YC41]
MSQWQRTIKKEVEYYGLGLFRGKEVTITLKPQPPDSGISFQRIDLKGSQPIPAHVTCLRNDLKRITLGRGEAEVEGIEHLMAAAAGLGITNLLVELTDNEMPAGDGSSKVFVELLKEGEVVEQQVTKNTFSLCEPLVVEEDTASIIALPFSEGLVLSHRLDFGKLSSLRQSFSLFITEEGSFKELFAARTFCLTNQIEEFQRLGLGKGVTEENSFLIDKEGLAITPIQRKPAALRYADEPVRHKVLDLLGDLYLTGVELKAKVFGIKSGHSLNVSMAKRLYGLMSREPSLKRQELKV